jgi:hypothetical protein
MTHRKALPSKRVAPLNSATQPKDSSIKCANQLHSRGQLMSSNQSRNNCPSQSHCSASISSSCSELANLSSERIATIEADVQIAKPRSKCGKTDPTIASMDDNSTDIDKLEASPSRLVFAPPPPPPEISKFRKFVTKIQVSAFAFTVYRVRFRSLSHFRSSVESRAFLR